MQKKSYPWLEQYPTGVPADIESPDYKSIGELMKESCLKNGASQAFENMGLRTTQLLGTLFDGITRHTEEAYRWAESFEEKGFREVIRERDAPFGDYGERSRKKT